MGGAGRVVGIDLMPGVPFDIWEGPAIEWHEEGRIWGARWWSAAYLVDWAIAKGMHPWQLYVDHHCFPSSDTTDVSVFLHTMPLEILLAIGGDNLLAIVDIECDTPPQEHHVGLLSINMATPAVPVLSTYLLPDTSIQLQFSPQGQAVLAQLRARIDDTYTVGIRTRDAPDIIGKLINQAPPVPQKGAPIQEWLIYRDILRSQGQKIKWRELAAMSGHAATYLSSYSSRSRASKPKP